ncbi:MAG: serine/threonine protein kinase [Planctomycetes bacterium]|nr:serine/threonine protein kinase [Planctomycetota bacterium]
MPLSDDHLITIVRNGGMLSPEQVREAREEARKSGRSLLAVVKEKRWLDDAEMAQVEAMGAYTPPPRDTVTPGTQVDSSAATVLGGATAPGMSEAEKPTAVPATRDPAPPTAVRPSGEAAPALPPVAHYDLLREIGRGGMGVVYEAFDRKLARRVALKTIGGPVKSGTVERLTREARAAAKLRHPNILQVYEVGEDAGRHYIAFELIEGESLEAKLRAYHGRDRVGSLQDLVELLRQAAAGLDFAHRAGIVHRDVKPSNILVDAAGRAVVGDFGLARDDSPGSGSDVRLTVEGAVLGTPGYLAPEQAMGKQAAAPADIYSLGASLYEVLTGRVPFQGGALAELLVRISTQDPVPPSRNTRQPVPAGLETICLKALARDPAARYATAGGFAEDLGRWLREEPVLARPAASGDPFLQNIRRNPGRAVAVVLVLLVFAAVTAERQRRKEKGGDKPPDPPAAAVQPRNAQEALQQGDREFTDARRLWIEAEGAPAAKRPERFAAATAALERAEGFYARGAASDPDSALARLRLGQVRRRLGRADAREALDAAVRLSDTPEARLERSLLGGCGALEHLFPPGIAIVEALEPGVSPPLRRESQASADAARADLQAAEKAGARAEELGAARAVDALGHGEAARAYELLRGTKGSGDPDALFAFALAAFYGGDIHEARDAFDVLYDAQPARPRSRLHRPLPHLAADPATAERFAADAAALCPDDPRADLVLAHAKLRRAGREGAEEALKLAMKHEQRGADDRPAAEAAKAEALRFLGRDGEAIASARSAHLIARGEPLYTFVLGRIQMMCGQGPEGRRTLQNFLDFVKGAHPLADEARKMLAR